MAGNTTNMHVRPDIGCPDKKRNSQHLKKKKDIFIKSYKMLSHNTKNFAVIFKQRFLHYTEIFDRQVLLLFTHSVSERFILRLPTYTQHKEDRCNK